MLNPDQFIENLYKETVGLQQKTNYDERWQENLKQQFQALLGQYESNTDLSPKVLEKKEFDDYIRLRVEIRTMDLLSMPVYLLIPKCESVVKRPSVLALHGHGYGNKDLVGLNPDGTEKLSPPGIHNNMAVELVKRGLIVAAPELVGFGDRRLQADEDKPPHHNSCFPIASQLLLMGKTIAGLRIFECQRVLDWLSTLPEVDEKQIGCIGFSGGGFVSAFTSALDERIKASVICGYTNTFKGSIMARAHCLDNYVPGILQIAEMPELIGLIAPRPLFIESGIDDPLFPGKHVLTALDKLRQIYDSFGAKTRLSADLFEGGHEISGKHSFDWLARMLNKAAP